MISSETDTYGYIKMVQEILKAPGTNSSSNYVINKIQLKPTPPPLQMVSSNLKALFSLSLEMKYSSGEVVSNGTIFGPIFTQICPLGLEVIKVTGKHTDT